MPEEQNENLTLFEVDVRCKPTNMKCLILAKLEPYAVGTALFESDELLDLEYVVTVPARPDW